MKLLPVVASGAVVLGPLLLGAGSASAETSLELAVKATYLYKLAPFVSWPNASWSTSNAPLLICVQGADPFGPLLDQATAGQWVGSHPVVVKRVARLEPDVGCQIAYVAGGTAQSKSQALQAVEGAPVLTVTDEARGPPARGIVHLLLDGGRVRFSIDAGQADRNGVAISSKLLALAVAVKR
ncbi:MAG: YfiR family protein [Phenylobacterium sp.]